MELCAESDVIRRVRKIVPIKDALIINRPKKNLIAGGNEKYEYPAPVVAQAQCDLTTHDEILRLVDELDEQGQRNFLRFLMKIRNRRGAS
jgi:hypothetical protein